MVSPDCHTLFGYVFYDDMNKKPVAQSQNQQIVLNLYEKGIFDIKDAINQVADRLNISKHTVYLYIRQFKSGDFQGLDK